MKSAASIMRKLKPAAFVMAAFAAMTLLASSAMAKPDLSRCPKGALCFWNAGNQMGQVWENKNLPIFWYRADAFFNNGRLHNVCLYSQTNYRGLGKKLLRKGQYLELGRWGIWSSVRSIKWTYRASC